MPALATPPTRRARLVAAVALGLGCGLLTAVCAALAPATGSVLDYEFWYRATRVWLAGGDPYALAPGQPGWPLDDPLFYPLPALVVTVPVAELAMPVAAGLTLGLAGAALAWAVSAPRAGDAADDATGRLWLFGSPCLLLACKVGQWSPLLAVAALVPAAGVFAAVKPTLGLAMLSYRPTWRGVLGAGAFGLVSLAWMPTWPWRWLANLAQVDYHPAPITTPLGVALLLAALRWRRAEARLLLALACVPQLLCFADQLAVGLVARTRREAFGLTTCGLVSAGLWWFATRENPEYVRAAAPYVLAGVYLPALLMVLRRPNAGAVPGWIESALARWRVPAWLCGTPVPATQPVRAGHAPTDA
jgi:hypothetical protein